MRGFLFAKRSCIGLCIFLFSQSVFAQRAFVFDYDGTIVEDRPDLGGIHETTYRLIRINYRSTAFQAEITGPEYVDVSFADYEAFTKKKYDPLTKFPQDPLILARGEGRVGSLKPYRLQDGRMIIPGHYMVDPYRTFFKFGEAPAGQNYFEESFAAAFKKAKRGEGTLKGGAFDLYYHLINNPDTIESVWMLSYRGHSQAEIFEKLKNDRDKRKLISKKVTDEQLRGLALRSIMLMRQEYHHFDNQMGIPRMAVLKGKYLSEIAKALLQVNPRDYVTQFNSRGEKNIRGVELFFAEDKYENIEAGREEVQDLANRRAFLKVIIHNLGRQEDIDLSERPKTYVLTPFSRERELNAAELSQSPALKLLFKSRTKKTKFSCFNYFGGGK